MSNAAKSLQNQGVSQRAFMVVHRVLPGICGNARENRRTLGVCW